MEQLVKVFCTDDHTLLSFISYINIYSTVQYICSEEQSKLRSVVALQTVIIKLLKGCINKTSSGWVKTMRYEYCGSLILIQPSLKWASWKCLPYISASSDNLARLWCVETGEIKREYSGHQKAVVCLAFNDSVLGWGGGGKRWRDWRWQTVCAEVQQGQKSNGLFGRGAVGFSGNYSNCPQKWSSWESGGSCLNITMNLSCVFQDVYSALPLPGACKYSA